MRWCELPPNELMRFRITLLDFTAPDWWRGRDRLVGPVIRGPAYRGPFDRSFAPVSLPVLRSSSLINGWCSFNAIPPGMTCVSSLAQYEDDHRLALNRTH